MIKSVFKAIVWAMFLIGVVSAADQKFQCFKHYFPVQHIAATPKIEIHYFYSFECAGCQKLAPALSKYFYESVQYPVYRHPLATSHIGTQLIKAYYALKQNEQGEQFVLALYELGGKKRITDHELLKHMKNIGHDHFEELWNSVDNSFLRKQIYDDLAMAKNYRLIALPMIYISGPKGLFSIYPNKDLALEDVPACIEAVIEFQKTQHAKSLQGQ
ncbi:MAG: hypothetical protein FJ161_02540 [Gammaproteobacteria bacterium]|nr:hypothetical protein [Gammaproteobacteria bacterium]